MYRVSVRGGHFLGIDDFIFDVVKKLLHSFHSLEKLVRPARSPIHPFATVKIVFALRLPLHMLCNKLCALGGYAFMNTFAGSGGRLRVQRSASRGAPERRR